MKIIYKAEDGTEFDVKEDCLNYEKGGELRLTPLALFEDCYVYNDEDNVFGSLSKELCIQITLI